MALSDEEIEKELKSLPGWEYKDNKISKEFRFGNFMESISFIIRLSSFFEQNNHHPDIIISYAKVKFDLQRYDIDGKVTDLDFLTAKEIERVYLLRNVSK